jgi:hypothetical protein
MQISMDRGGKVGLFSIVNSLVWALIANGRHGEGISL